MKTYIKNSPGKILAYKLPRREAHGIAFLAELIMGVLLSVLLVNAIYKTGLEAAAGNTKSGLMFLGCIAFFFALFTHFMVRPLKQVLITRSLGALSVEASAYSAKAGDRVKVLIIGPAAAPSTMLHATLLNEWYFKEYKSFATQAKSGEGKRLFEKSIRLHSRSDPQYGQTWSAHITIPPRAKPTEHTTSSGTAWFVALRGITPTGRPFERTYELNVEQSTSGPKAR